MNSVWTDHYQRPLLTVCLYPRGAEGQSKLQQRPLIANLPLCVKFGTKLIGIRKVRVVWYGIQAVQDVKAEFIFDAKKKDGFDFPFLVRLWRDRTGSTG